MCTGKQKFDFSNTKPEGNRMKYVGGKNRLSFTVGEPIDLWRLRRKEVNLIEEGQTSVVQSSPEG